MELTFGELDGVKVAALKGRLDTAGVDVIELRFSAGIVPDGKNTLVDLSGVEFLASMGVRLFIATARALQTRGGKLVMFGATPAVTDTIEIMGFDDIVPLAPSQAAALALLC